VLATPFSGPVILINFLTASTGPHPYSHFKNRPLATHWWLTPVILATQEAEIRKIRVQSQPPRQTVYRSYLENTQHKTGLVE
jgi:hypothetical protein